jgi:hypothetical protein
MLILSTMFLALFFTACAPKLEEKEWTQPRTQFGPLKEDNSDLDRPNALGERAKPEFVWHGRIEPSVLFELSENLQYIAANTDLPDLKNMAHGFTTSLFLNLPQEDHRTAFIDSDYIKLVLQEATPSAEQSLKELVSQVEKNRNDIKLELKTLGSSYQPLAKGSLRENRRRAFDFVSRFTKRLNKMNLHPTIRKALETRIAKEVDHLQTTSFDALQKIEKSKSLKSTLLALQGFLASAEIELPIENQKQFSDGLKLGEMIETFSDADGALNLIGEIWKQMTPKDRNQDIRSANLELFQYLTSHDSSLVSCLADNNCRYLYKLVPRSMILSKISAYGLDNLRTQINAAAKEKAIQTVQEAAAEKLKDLPKILATTIESHFEPEAAKLVQLRDNFSTNIKDRLNLWTKANLTATESTLFAMKPSVADIDLTGTAIDLNWNSTALDSSHNSLQASLLALLPSLWESNAVPKPILISTQLAGINQVSHAYLHPEEIPQIFTARAHAEELRGLLKVFSYFRDWEANSFDAGLGGHKAQELFPEYEASELDSPLFPKPALMSLTLSNLAYYLRAITEENSPVFLVDLENKITWANKFDFNSSSIQVMAGIVDRVQNQRATYVSSENVSRYILALTEFIRATENLQKSKSPYLQNKLDSGKTALETIQEARSKIRLLILGLANYLSHQFKAGGDFVVPSLDVTTQLPLADREPQVIDQMLAIRALIESSQSLGISLYEWEAQDLYYSMNQKMFNSKTGFYGTKPLELPEMVESLRTLTSLKSHLPSRSQSRLEKLTARWLKELATLQLHTDAN